MLTLKQYDAKPCSGGWPLLVREEYTLDEYPEYVLVSSYYRGLGVNPLPCVTIQKNGRQIGPTVHPYECDEYPTQYHLESWLRTWLEGNRSFRPKGDKNYV